MGCRPRDSLAAQRLVQLRSGPRLLFVPRLRGKSKGALGTLNPVFAFPGGVCGGGRMVAETVAQKLEPKVATTKEA